MESYGNPTIMHWDHGESFFQTSRLQSWDFVTTNSSAPRAIGKGLEKVVLGDGYTPSNLLSPEWWPISPTELWGGRESHKAVVLYGTRNYKDHGSQARFIRRWKKQRRGRTVHHMHCPSFGDGRNGNPHGATLPAIANAWRMEYTAYFGGRKPHGMHLRITTGGFAEVAPSWV